jgi:AraC-type DNA-binding domain-containing proteins
MNKNMFQPVQPNNKKLPFGCRLQVDKTKQIILPHWHDTYEIDYVIQSSNQNFYLDGKTFDQSTNEIVCVNPYQIHGLNLPNDENRVAITLMIPLLFLDNLNINKLDLQIQNRIIDSKNEHYLLLKSLFRELYSILTVPEDVLSRTEEIGLVSAILGILFRYFSKKTAFVLNNYSSKRIRYIRDVLEWLNSNYMNDVSIAEMAQRISLSESYFSHVFKQTVGQSPLNYLSSLRAVHAQQIIQNEDRTMTEIASMVGFSNVKSMNETFKKDLGITPYQYKIQQKKAGFDIF